MTGVKFSNISRFIPYPIIVDITQGSIALRTILVNALLRILFLVTSLLGLLVFTFVSVTWL